MFYLLSVLDEMKLKIDWVLQNIWRIDKGRETDTVYILFDNLKQYGFTIFFFLIIKIAMPKMIYIDYCVWIPFMCS